MLTGAVVHAAWNLLLAGAKDSEAAGAVALASGAVIFTPVALATWDIGAAAWPYIVVSAVLELAYFVLLGRAYARAELSLVYPIARGSAPVLVLLASAVLGTRWPTGQVIGILAVAAGIVAIRGLRRGVHRADLVLALGVGAMHRRLHAGRQGGAQARRAAALPLGGQRVGRRVYLPLLAWARGSRLRAAAAWVRGGRPAGRPRPPAQRAGACCARPWPRARSWRASACSAPTP